MKELIDTIIYGAGNAGIRLAKKIKKKQNVSFFVDDKKILEGKKFYKTEVISYKNLIKLSKKKIIKNIIVAIPSLDFEKRKKIFRKLLLISEIVTTLPFNSELIDDKVSLSDIKKVSFDELIDIQVVKINYKDLNFYKGKNILVTGSAGSIGSELCSQLNKLKASKIVMIDHSESALSNFIFKNKDMDNKKSKFILGNILDAELINKIIKQYKIDIVFHTAAYKHIDLLEDNISEAIKNNIFGTKNILDQIRNSKKKIKFIYVSTDKAVNPISFLGYTKAFGEILTEIYSIKYKIDIHVVRFGNVFASDGSVLDKFVYQIKSDKEITLTSYKMKRYFMSIKEACHLLLRCPTLKLKNKLFILNMGNQIKIIDIIKKLFKYYNKIVKIRVIGLRLGEKLEEELSYNKLRKTNDKYIFSTTNPYINNIDLIEQFLATIYQKTLKKDEKNIRKEFKKFFKKYEANKIS
jgi:FlaA1/EpsC-like NDP-sugar epimerase